jgi:hypothetical protein
MRRNTYTMYVNSGSFVLCLVHFVVYFNKLNMNDYLFAMNYSKKCCIVQIYSSH